MFARMLPKRRLIVSVAAVGLVFAVNLLIITVSRRLMDTTPEIRKKTVTLRHSLDLIPKGLPKQADRLKKIAFGTPYWAKFELWKNIFQRFDEGKCPVSSCVISYDENDTDEADVLLFNAANMKDNFTMPRRNNSDQIWVMFTQESIPMMEKATSYKWSRYDGFNWTMAYWLDSDVFAPYGAVIPIEPSDTTTVEPRNRWLEKQSQHRELVPKTPSKDSGTNLAEKGSNETSPDQQEVLVSWMVSHCITASNREGYVKELQKYIAIDIYGKCGSKDCAMRETILNLSDDKEGKAISECSKVMESYYFYISFENSLCKDYVTEKFFKILKLDVVPVVFGSADYEAIGPPNSYINALDFASPKDLAEYLKKVAASEELYNSFFEWKTKYSVDLGLPYSTMVCDLCAKMQGHHRETVPRSTKYQRASTDGPITDARPRTMLERIVDKANCLTWTPSGLEPQIL